MRPIVKLSINGALIVTTSVTILSLIGFGARYWWAGELLSQPRPQYALALILCLPFVVWQYPRAGWLILIPLLLNIGTFAPLYLPPHGDLRSTSRQYSVLHYNLDNTLSSHTKAFAYLREHPVDILSLQEFTPKDEINISQELPGYFIAYSHPLTNSHGSAVLVSKKSGIEVRSANITHLPEYSVRPLIETTLVIHGQEVAFLNLHVIRPVSAWNTDFQQIEFASAAEWSRSPQELGQAVLMIGDLNSTPWSWNFRQFQQEGHLLNSGQGFGLESTWPAGLPSIFTIPIDHCLHSPEIVITDRYTGPFLGSDHAPLHVEFFLKK